MRDAIPIALGYLAVAFTLGIAARNAGVYALPATIMSLTNTTSAGEFAAITAIAGGVGYAELALMQLVINLRYMLMSCALTQKLDPKFSIIHRFFIGFGVTDEIFGISVARKGKLNPCYMYGAMSIAIPAWPAPASVWCSVTYCRAAWLVRFPLHYMVCSWQSLSRLPETIR